MPRGQLPQQRVNDAIADDIRQNNIHINYNYRLLDLHFSENPLTVPFSPFYLSQPAHHFLINLFTYLQPPPEWMTNGHISQTTNDSPPNKHVERVTTRMITPAKCIFAFPGRTLRTWPGEDGRMDGWMEHQLRRDHKSRHSFWASQQTRQANKQRALEELWPK